MVKALKRSLRIPRKPSKIMAWPGNVRELMNVIERAVIVSDGPVLQVAEKIDVLPIGPVREEASESIETRATKGLAEAERKHILRTLEETGWRIEGQKGAAQFLGMNPSTIRARMRKLGIKRPGTH
jgi:transcriptional regulator with GAF, ATPase, and Fis domain